MNIHYLKKIRKRYEWYFNPQGFPVLLDKKLRTVQVYNVEYVLQITGHINWTELIEKSWVKKDTPNKEVAFYVLKQVLYRYIGEAMPNHTKRTNYNMAKKRLDNLKGKKSYENNNTDTQNM